MIVAAGDYVLLGCSDGSSWGYDTPADYYYGSISFGNSSGDYAYIYYDDGSTITDIDQMMNYSGIGGSGVSAQLDVSNLNGTASSDSDYWCSSTATFDSTLEYGSPGMANESCF